MSRKKFLLAFELSDVPLIFLMFPPIKFCWPLLKAPNQLYLTASKIKKPLILPLSESWNLGIIFNRIHINELKAPPKTSPAKKTAQMVSTSVAGLLTEAVTT